MLPGLDPVTARIKANETKKAQLEKNVAELKAKLLDYVERTSATPQQKSQVIQAIEDSDYVWRTVEGIAKETGLNEATVHNALGQLADDVLKSKVPDKHGRDLYTTPWRLYETNTKRFWLLVVAIAVVFAVISAFLSTAPEGVKRLILAVWTVGCPAWFTFEWRYLMRGGKGASSRWFERFKYSQELASKFWLAVIAVLAALYFGDKLVR
jgi:hypothetical protein